MDNTFITSPNVSPKGLHYGKDIDIDAFHPEDSMIPSPGVKLSPSSNGGGHRRSRSDDVSAGASPLVRTTSYEEPNSSYLTDLHSMEPLHLPSGDKSAIANSSYEERALERQRELHRRMEAEKRQKEAERQKTLIAKAKSRISGETGTLERGLSTDTSSSFNEAEMLSRQFSDDNIFSPTGTMDDALRGSLFTQSRSPSVARDSGE